MNDFEILPVAPTLHALYAEATKVMSIEKVVLQMTLLYGNEICKMK